MVCILKVKEHGEREYEADCRLLLGIISFRSHLNIPSSDGNEKNKTPTLDIYVSCSEQIATCQILILKWKDSYSATSRDRTFEYRLRERFLLQSICN